MAEGSRHVGEILPGESSCGEKDEEILQVWISISIQSREACVVSRLMKEMTSFHFAIC